MSKVTLIAAIGRNRELGKNNDLIWKIPEDLKFFKDNTIGKTIVMGINTFNSLPKLLPGRKHIVLTSKNVLLDDSVMLFHNLDDLLEFLKTLDEEIMVIGGASLYNQMIDYSDKMILTEINCESEADVYFPSFSLDSWDREVFSNHEYNGIDYSHVIYTRKRVK